MGCCVSACADGELLVYLLLWHNGVEEGRSQVEEKIIAQSKILEKECVKICERKSVGKGKGRGRSAKVNRRF